MIRYLGTGKRNYRSRPIPLNARSSWEFQVILKGKAAPILSSGEVGFEPKGQCLWVFPPDHLHGWRSNQSCEVLVFHLARMPEALSAVYSEMGCVDLAVDELKRLKELAAVLQKEMHAPSACFGSMALMTQGILGWIALKGAPQGREVEQESALALVERTMGWFDAHMQDGVGANELADYAGLSVSHLRRLFHEAIGTSPREAINKARLARAETLLRAGTLKQEAIAQACGFGSLQAFSRFFRVAHGVAPGVWVERANWSASKAH